jgi:hypothetical protein
MAPLNVRLESSFSEIPQYPGRVCSSANSRILIQRSRVSPKVRLVVHCGLKSNIARVPRRATSRLARFSLS